jgi:hypothetical protein
VQYAEGIARVWVRMAAFLTKKKKEIKKTIP